MARSTEVVILGVIFFTAACGGKTTTAAGEDSGSPSDSSSVEVDASSDVDPTDTASPVDSAIDLDAACSPTGTCGLGGSCRADGPATCTCIDHGYVCSTCSDPTTSGCPDALPCLGTSCTTEGLGCYYQSDCGAVDNTVCIGGRWSVRIGKCSAACPRTEPIPGSPCTGSTAPTFCALASECRQVGRAWCIDDHWSVFRGCGESLACGADAIVGAACTTEHVECTRSNTCGGQDRLTCRAGTWTRTASSCCPTTPPTTGTACTTPSALACAFPGTDCYCQSDGKFLCWPRPTTCSDGAACSGSVVCHPTTDSSVCVCKAGKLECAPLTPGE